MFSTVECALTHALFRFPNCIAHETYASPKPVVVQLLVPASEKRRPHGTAYFASARSPDSSLCVCVVGLPLFICVLVHSAFKFCYRPLELR